MVVGAHERPERCGSRDSARAEASPGTGTRYAANACSTMMLLRGLSWPATASSLPASSCTLSVMELVLALIGKQLSTCNIAFWGATMQWLCQFVWHLLRICPRFLPKAGSAYALSLQSAAGRCFCIIRGRCLTSIWTLGTFLRVPHACARLASARAGIASHTARALSTALLTRTACCTYSPRLHSSAANVHRSCGLQG